MMLSAYISINGSVGCTKQWSRTAGQEHARQPMNQSSQKAASFGYFFTSFLQSASVDFAEELSPSTD
jgi:hypothetical protein